MASRPPLFLAIFLALSGCGSSKTDKDKAAEAAAARPVPVTTVMAGKHDVPIFLDGLGTVTAWKTVTVRSQVDGKLDKVAFREGQTVKAGDLLAQIDARPFQAMLHQAEGAESRDQSQVTNNKLNLERYASLRKQNLIAQQQVDDQKAAVALQEGSLAVDRAQIETAKLNLSYCRITAPVDGVTGVRLVDEGNLVRANDATTGIVVITQIDPIAVIFTLPEDDLHSVSEHMNEGTLIVEAFDRDGEVKLGEGKLLVLDNQINQATATLRLKAIFDNPKRALWPNQFVKARLHIAQRKDAVVVPATAVQRGPKGTFAYIVKDDVASPRPIEIEQLVRDQAIIKSGIAPGDEVVIEGQNQLRPGSKVAKVKPEGSGDGGGDGKGGGKGKGGKGKSGKGGGEGKAGAQAGAKAGESGGGGQQ
jgi:multidrug efflux system membrane fusion protein